jgi:hypothetical protein
MIHYLPHTNHEVMKMMRWRGSRRWQVILVLGLIASIVTYQLHAYADSYPWLEDMTLDVKIETDTTIYEWEYENPNSFEYEEGSLIKRGEKAKDSFEHLLQVLDLTQSQITDDMVSELSKEFKQIRRISARRVDGDHCLQTWVWNHNGNEE